MPHRPWSLTRRRNATTIRRKHRWQHQIVEMGLPRLIVHNHRPAAESGCRHSRYVLAVCAQTLIPQLHEAAVPDRTAVFSDRPRTVDTDGGQEVSASIAISGLPDASKSPRPRLGVFSQGVVADIQPHLGGHAATVSTDRRSVDIDELALPGFAIDGDAPGSFHESDDVGLGQWFHLHHRDDSAAVFTDGETP